jgi:hypothetical protein
MKTTLNRFLTTMPVAALLLAAAGDPELPEEELTALAAILPENEAALLRDSATALRTQPEGPLEVVLSPVFTKYWNQSLRAKVRAELHRLSKSKNPEQRANR